MFTNSEKVIRWRKATKQRMVDSFGGKCGICGYSKCVDVLEFHHLDPNEKDFGLSGMRAGPKKWEKIVQELRKCVMLCSNCHREVHAEILEIPQNIKKYNEEYTDYKEKRRQEHYDNCPVCGKEKYKGNKTCSLSCASTLRGKVNYPPHNILKKMVEEKGYCEVGRHFGVTDNAIRKRLNKQIT